MSQGRTGPGVTILLSSLIVPFLLFICLGATRTSDFATKVSKATEQAKIAQTAEAAKLKVIESSCSGESGMSWISGKVTNGSNQKFSIVQVTGSFYAKDGHLIDTASGFIDVTPLLPGQTSTFKILGPRNQAVSKCQVDNVVPM